MQAAAPISEAGREHRNSNRARRRSCAGTGGPTLSGSWGIANGLRIGAHRVTLLRGFTGGLEGGLNFEASPKGVKLSHNIGLMVPEEASHSNFFSV